MKYCFLFVSCLLLSCSPRASQNYWFRGDIYSTGGRVFEHSILSFPTDSTFIFSALGSFSRRQRAQYEYFDVTCYSGTVVTRGDTVTCQVRESTDGFEGEYVFYRRGRKIFLHGFENQWVQTYRPYRGKKRRAGYHFPALYYIDNIQCCEFHE